MKGGEECLDDSFKLKFHLLDGKGKPCGVFDDAILRYIKETQNLFLWPERHTIMYTAHMWQTFPAHDLRR